MATVFDLVVIGGGPGGYVAALRAAQLGLKVACIEKRATFGGTCLNVGCIPSKAMLDSSELFVQARTHFGHHGIQVGNLGLDLAKLLERKNAVVSQLVKGVAGLLKRNGVTTYHGSGTLAGQGRVTVTADGQPAETIEAKAILLATGSEPAPVPALPFDGMHIVSSTEALAFERVPQTLIVVGGGYIGLELGSVWARLGAKVLVLEFLPRILPNTDGELAALVHKSLAGQGLEFHLGTKVLSAKVAGSQVTVTAERDGQPLTFTGDRVLVAVGRRPLTNGLNLEAAGVQLDKTGRVIVDAHYRTTAAGIYALGDLTAGPMLAHKASEEGVAIAEHLAGKGGHVNYDTIPSVIYIWPEVASVGPTEEQLKSAGRAYKVGKFPFKASGRALCMDEPEGIVKVISDAKTDRLLAVHIFGPRASDLIAEAVTTMEFGGSAEDIARITHAHPTLSEAVAEAAKAAAFGKALHA